MAPEDVVVRMGDCMLDDNAQTLDAMGVECGAMLEVVIAREAIAQKVAGIYAATEVAPIEHREAARKEQRLQEQKRQEERRIREERQREERRLREERQRKERRLREEREQEERQRLERERAKYRPHWQIFKTNFQASPQYVEYLEKEKKRRENEREARRKAAREAERRR